MLAVLSHLAQCCNTQKALGPQSVQAVRSWAVPQQVGLVAAHSASAVGAIQTDNTQFGWVSLQCACTVAWCDCSRLGLCTPKKEKRKEKTTPFGVNLTRSLVIYQAAQIDTQTCRHAVSSAQLEACAAFYRQVQIREGRGNVWELHHHSRQAREGCLEGRGGL